MTGENIRMLFMPRIDARIEKMRQELKDRRDPVCPDEVLLEYPGYTVGELARILGIREEALWACKGLGCAAAQCARFL